MKKITFACVAMVSLALAGCNGTATYDSYVETLEGQPAIIDTISSAPSYAGYLESLAAMAAEFDSKDVNLGQIQRPGANTYAASLPLPCGGSQSGRHYSRD